MQAKTRTVVLIMKRRGQRLSDLKDRTPVLSREHFQGFSELGARLLGFALIIWRAIMRMFRLKWTAVPCRPKLESSLPVRPACRSATPPEPRKGVPIFSGLSTGSGQLCEGNKAELPCFTAIDHVSFRLVFPFSACRKHPVPTWAWSCDSRGIWG